MVHRYVPVVATVSAKGLMHLPNSVRTGLGLKEGGRIVFFVDSKSRRAILVPEIDAFQFPVEDP